MKVISRMEDPKKPEASTCLQILKIRYLHRCSIYSSEPYLNCNKFCEKTCINMDSWSCWAPTNIRTFIIFIEPTKSVIVKFTCMNNELACFHSFWITLRIATAKLLDESLFSYKRGSRLWFYNGIFLKHNMVQEKVIL